MSRSRSQAHAQAERRPVSRATPPAADAPPRAWAIAGAVVATGLAIMLLVRLAGQAAHARLYTDECFHAYAAEWIAGHGRLPVDFPEFYAGFHYYYPPLLHLLGAVWVALLGSATLLDLNVVLFGLLLLTAACPIVPGMPAAPRRWAVLLLVSHRWLALYAVRFYVEMLISLLALAVALLIVRYHRTTRMRDAVGLGIATGLALVAKQTGAVLALAVAGCAVGTAVGRDRARLRGYLAALGVALVIALPYFARNAALFGSPVYPIGAPPSAAHEWSLRFKGMSPPPALFYRLVFSAVGPTMLAAAGVAIAIAAWRRQTTVLAGVAVAGLMVIAVRRATPLFDVRHTMPMIGLLAVGGSVVVWEGVRRWARVMMAIEVVLVVVAALAVARLGPLRASVDLPPRLAVAYDAIRDDVPVDAAVLSLWTYDTFYYSRRRALWPVDWSRGEQPFELFYEHDPARFDTLLSRYRIDYLLLPKVRPPPEFNGGNYPESFVACIEALGRAGVLRMVWQSPELALVGRTSSPPSAPAGSPPGTPSP